MLELDHAADRAQRELERSLEALAHQRMEDDVETLVRALREGHLLPEDF